MLINKRRPPCQNKIVTFLKTCYNKKKEIQDIIVMLKIQSFQKLNYLETIAITKHAKDRLFERGISVDDIINAIDMGEIYQTV